MMEKNKIKQCTSKLNVKTVLHYSLKYPPIPKILTLESKKHDACTIRIYKWFKWPVW